MRLRFRDWPVLVKLAAAFLCIMLALITANVLVDRQYDSMGQQVEHELGEVAVPGLEAMAQLSYQVPLMRVHIYRYCFFTDPQRRVKINEELIAAHEGVNAALAAYRKTAIDDAKKGQRREPDNHARQVLVVGPRNSASHQLGQGQCHRSSDDGQVHRVVQRHRKAHEE